IERLAAGGEPGARRLAERLVEDNQSSAAYLVGGAKAPAGTPANDKPPLFLADELKTACFPALRAMGEIGVAPFPAAYDGAEPGGAARLWLLKVMSRIPDPRLAALLQGVPRDEVRSMVLAEADLLSGAGVAPPSTPPGTEELERCVDQHMA